MTDDGLVQVEESLRLIEQTEGSRHEGVREYWRSRRGEKTGAESGAAADAPADANRPTMSKADWDRREAAARAQLKEMELATAVGSLVEAETVRRAGAEAGAVIRTALENLPDQIAPQLVALADEAKIHALLVDHVETLLTDIAAALEAAIGAKDKPKSI